MNSLPTPLPQPPKQKAGYVFDGSENNRLMSDCDSRRIERERNTPEAKAEQAKRDVIQTEYDNRKPDPKIINQWIEALRSGQYKQEKYFLKARNDNNYFSVLGVLLDITRHITGGEWHGQWWVKKGRSFENWTKDGNCNISIPPFALKKLGLKSVSNLIELNEEHDFKELILIIEKEYLTT